MREKAKMKNLALMWVLVAAAILTLCGCKAAKDKAVPAVDTSAVAADTVASAPDTVTLPPVISEDGFEMVFVEGGTFTMKERVNDGNEIAAVDRKFPVNGFFLSKYEVTQGLWKSVMGRNPATETSTYSGVGDDYPVYCVSWSDAQKFIQKLNAKTGKKYRLPMNDEWIYAARGGNRSRGYKYSGSNDIDDVAWYEDNSGDTVHPVGAKHPNELGVHDMSGNVPEWVHDRANWKDYRIVRGGGLESEAKKCGIYYTDGEDPDRDFLRIGFRLAHDARITAAVVEMARETKAAAPSVSTFTDSRDGKTYKRVVIGTQTWMGQNLNYATEGSKCYNNSPDSCAKYGRLYDWETAVNACPAGFRLPTDDEWTTLVVYAGGKARAGKKLKSTSGWTRDGNGTDDYGFSALPGGYDWTIYDDFSSDAGISGFWWIAIESIASYPWARYMTTDDEVLWWGGYSTRDMYSIRCIQDEEKEPRK
jgi:uncharacterized protein (TIGR02145 family)